MAARFCYSSLWDLKQLPGMELQCSPHEEAKIAPARGATGPRNGPRSSGRRIPRRMQTTVYCRRRALQDPKRSTILSSLLAETRSEAAARDACGRVPVI